MPSTAGPLGRIARAGATLRYELIVIGLPLALYVLYTALGLAGTGPGGKAGWPGQFMASMAAFGVMSAALATAGLVARGANAGRGSGADARPVVVGWLAALALAGGAVVAVSLAGALLHDVTLTPANWLYLLASLWVGAIPFLVLGRLLHRLVHPDATGIIVLGVAIALGVLGGLFQPLSSLPPLLARIAAWLPSYHLASLGWSATAGRAPMPVDILVLAAYTVGLLAVLRWTGGNERGRAHG